jgi:GNAT superfamily N-acetyltransferase
VEQVRAVLADEPPARVPEGVQIVPVTPERAENALTAVRREWRGRGVAAALGAATAGTVAGSLAGGGVTNRVAGPS